jgi:hypothetical protein
MVTMLLSHLSIFMAMLLTSQGLDVRSGTECPSGQAILEKLRPLLAEHGEAGDVAWVDVASPEPNQPPALRVRLVRADANVIADRRLPVQGGCEEMADTVATVLAAWEAPPTPPPVVLMEEGRPRLATVSHHKQLWLGASGGAGLLGGIAAVGNLELLLEHTSSHLLGRAAMTGQTTRQSELSPGDVVWRRTHGSLGLGWQLRRPDVGSYWQLSIDADLLLGWLTVSGRGFSPNAHKTAFEAGFGAGVRGQRNLGGWALWVEARANLWPAPERAALTGQSQATTQLPRLDILASLGVSLRALR